MAPLLDAYADAPVEPTTPPPSAVDQAMDRAAENVVVPSRAPTLKDAGFEFDPQTTANMGQDLPTGLFATKTPDPEDPESFRTDMQEMVDLAALRKRLITTWRQGEVNRRKSLNLTPMTPEESRDLDRKLWSDAQQALAAQVSRANTDAFLFADTDPDGYEAELARTGGLPDAIVQALDKLPESTPTGLFRDHVIGSSALFNAWIHGRGGRSYTPVKDEATGRWRLEHGDLEDRSGVLGKIEFIGQAAPSTFISTAIAAGFDREAKGEVDLLDIPVLRQFHAYREGRFTEEQVSRVRKGEDLFTFAPELGSAWLDTYGNVPGAAIHPIFIASGRGPVAKALGREPDDEGALATLVGGAMGFGVAMVEPDLISAGLYGAGKGWRLARGVQRTGEALGIALPGRKAWSSAGRWEGLQEALAEEADGLSRAVDEGASMEEVTDLAHKAIQRLSQRSAFLPAYLQSRLKAQLGSGVGIHPTLSKAVFDATQAHNRLESASKRLVDKMFSEGESLRVLQPLVKAHQKTQAALDAARAPVKKALRKLKNDPELEQLEQAYKDAWKAQQRLGPRASKAAVAEASKARAAALQARDARKAALAAEEARIKASPQYAAFERAAEAEKVARKEMLKAQAKADNAVAQALHEAVASENYADHVLLETLRTAKEAAERAGSVGAKSRSIPKAAARQAASTYLVQLERLSEIQAQLAKATDPVTRAHLLDKAQKTAEELAKTNVLGLHATDNVTSRALDALIDQAAKATKASDADYADVVKILMKDESLRIPSGFHRKRLAALRGAMFRGAQSRQTVAALSDSMRQLSASYGKLRQLAEKPVADIAAVEDLPKTIGALLKQGQGVVDGAELKALLESASSPEAVAALIRDPGTAAIKSITDAMEAGGPFQFPATSLMDMITRLRWAHRASQLDGAEAAFATEMRRLTQDYLTERTMENSLLRWVNGWMKAVNRSVIYAANPHMKDLGIFVKALDFQQLGKSVVGGARLTQNELLRVMGAVGGDSAARAAAAEEFITNPRASFGRIKVFSHAAFGEQSLWDASMRFLRGLSKDAMGESDFIRGLSRMWMVDGTVNPERGNAVLMSAAMKILRDGVGGSGAPPTFQEFSEHMLKATLRLENGMEPTIDMIRARRAKEVLRANGYAAQIVGAAASVGHVADGLALRSVGVTPEGIKAAAQILGNAEEFVGGAEAFDQAYKLFSLVGLPPKTYEQGVDVGRRLQRGITALEGSGSVGKYVPMEWMHYSEKTIEPLVKRFWETSEKSGDTVGSRLRDLAQMTLRLFRTGVTSGVLFLSPRYLATNSFSLVSQIGVEDSFASALRAVAAGGGAAAMESWPVLWLSKSKPVAKAMDYAYTRALKAWSSGGGPAPLPTVANVIHNPTVSAIFDPAQFPDSMVLPSAHGVHMTMGQFRRFLHEEEVLTSHASANIMELATRAASLTVEANKWTLPWLLGEARRGSASGVVEASVNAAGRNLSTAERLAAGAKGAAKEVGKHAQNPLKILDERGQTIAGIADVIEQRQRAALFMDLVVNRGMLPSRAGEIVREAAYDWNHAMSASEESLIAPLIMFARAMKVMWRQGVRTAFDPFLRAVEGKGLGLGQAGGNKLGRVRGLEGFTQTTASAAQEQMAGDLDYDPEAELDAQRDWMLQEVRPWWSGKGSRMVLTNTALTPEEREAVKRARGADATHMAYSMPSHGVSEFTGHVFALQMGLMRTVLGEQTFAQGLRDFANGAAEMGGPSSSEALKAVVSMYLGDNPEDWSPDGSYRPKLNSFERSIYEMGWGSLLGAAPDPKDPTVIRGSRGAVSAFRTFVPLMNEIGTYHQVGVDIESGMAGDTAADALGYGFRQTTGLMRAHPFDPQKTLESRAKYGVEEMVKEEERKFGKPEKAKSSTRPSGRPMRPKRPRRPERPERPTR